MVRENLALCGRQPRIAIRLIEELLGPDTSTLVPSALTLSMMVCRATASGETDLMAISLSV
jgi:hypothetical protein